jgi:CDP-diacylglycerol pyrophosphatase
MGSLLVTGKRLGYLAFLSLALATLHASHARPNDPDALWNIVNQECVPNQQKHADPAPCSEVSISNGVERGFAVLKDNAASKPYAFLLIPTRRITGIESPLLLGLDAPNYFQFAWTARSYVLGAVHTAPSATAIPRPPRTRSAW